MAMPDTAEVPRLTRDDLVGHIAAGAKLREDWRIGTEHEKFVFRRDTLAPVPYDGQAGIAALLAGLADRFGWQPVFDGENLIALEGATSGGSITLEPGGQFELSGAPLQTLHETCAEVGVHLAQVREVGDPMGLGFIGLGFAPTWALADVPVMPKTRYRIMRSYMPKVGTRGLDMMFRTATVQVNLDFGSEADMVKKLRVSLALQPIATAIFANSPFTEGRPNGRLSERSEVWRDTDRARSGMLPFAFGAGMGYEGYVDWALDVPMYFVKRGKHMIDTSGASFRDFLSGRLPMLPGELPREEDWADHLTTIFPEVRLKRFLEMRGADGGPWNRLCALPAFWVGLLYDDAALEAAWQLVRGWSDEDRQGLRDAVPGEGFAARVAGRSALDVARDAVAIARDGLKARGRPGLVSPDETVYLETVETIVARGQSPAERLLEAYRGRWGGDISRIFADEAY